MSDRFSLQDLSPRCHILQLSSCAPCTAHQKVCVSSMLHNRQVRRICPKQSQKLRQSWCQMLYRSTQRRERCWYLEEVVLQENRIKIHKLSTEVVNCLTNVRGGTMQPEVTLLWDCSAGQKDLFYHCLKKSSIVVRSRSHSCDASAKTMSKNKETKASSFHWS